MEMMETRTSILVLMFGIARLISTVGLTVDRSHLPCVLGMLDLDLELDGHMDFFKTHVAATDFGNRHTVHPAAVLYPASVRDIATLVKSVYRCGPSSKITVAAKGHAHSLNGQAQAENGIVIEMSSLKDPIKVHRHADNDNNNNINTGNSSYADVNGGELWIHVLNKTLEEGLAPRSWTDYLYLTVGGTLSNAGISGQAFRHGPQISNVFQLEVVTGRGEVVTCSKDQNAELFHAVLGGLGQFGIITKARIALEPAPQRVRWIRVLYSDFQTFSKDQEYLISDRPKGHLTFDYLEGFVIVNNDGLLNNWRSSFFSPQNPVKVATLNTKGLVLYCLEMALNYRDDDAIGVDRDVTSLLSSLNFIPSSVFTTDLPYVDFLDRVHVSELKLRANGLWDVPHPWLNLFIPATKIAEFDARVFKHILRNTTSGPILIYPMNRNKWDEKMSAMTPDEDKFYLVGLLRSALPSTNIDGSYSLQHLTDQNDQILAFCNKAGIGAKQYLPHYTDESEWRRHFGKKWSEFVDWKATYDPNAILAPGQRIFSKSQLPLPTL